uniref:Putative LOC100213065 [Hydra vulgaris] n=1 Tax=Lepeophtheirus salmonis TaxID=72036 RepID=A0A0K2V713_LEPSM
MNLDDFWPWSMWPTSLDCLPLDHGI